MPTVCDACLSEPSNGKLKRCSLCRSAWYCNAQCQKDHWAEHKVQCKKLTKALKAKAAKAKPSKTPEITQDKVSAIIDNERVTIARVTDPLDGFQYQVFMPKEAFGSYITNKKPQCWCGDVGNQQSLLAVFAFDTKALPKDPKKSLKSSYLSGFGVNFQLQVHNTLGNITVNLVDESGPNNPKNTPKGVNCITTHFFVSGKSADTLSLPPPSEHADFKNSGVQECNSSMGVWSSVGSNVNLGVHKIKDSLTIPGTSLDSASFALAPGFLVENKPMVAIAVLIEKVSEVTTHEEFETAVIASQLHRFHSESVPSAKIPPFCTSAIKQGLSKLNMGMPVSVVGVLEEDIPQKLTAGKGGKSNASKEAKPGDLNNLSAEARADLDEIMDSFSKGKPDLALIERGLGNPELCPVLQSVMSSPQVAPMMARMMSEAAGK
mmetsp:Transcript_10212/g.20946  ORF Transcript_10212/g.20946 Transcript_10212/m.20946 type:complete len:434 (+) Transcript_10212:103-1404(+)|eukprot:CAMPEP_0118648126 /NCGR_PEP_ID=MMETSP0785-20121206/8984_1 /TAXON_ID=91992 /ORGANISM="Bolidomonas pacifica, Strain CCMP 1866" /LENGTH=433 /DNA_ID=CAMNT_0006540287 /DNA_START=85 /DNA_END=1386 /DNA_ORIENTATION=+